MTELNLEHALLSSEMLVLVTERGDAGDGRPNLAEDPPNGQVFAQMQAQKTRI